MAPRRAAGRVGSRAATRSTGRIVALVAAVALVVGGAIAFTAVRASSSTGDDGCASTQTLRIVATPEIVEAVTAAVALQGGADDCLRPTVTSGDASSVLSALRKDGGARPDVWIPDSSLWTTGDRASGAGLSGSHPSLARSPLTVAVPRAVADRLSAHGRTAHLDALLPTAPASAGAVRWVLPDPAVRMSSTAALLEIRRALGRRPQGPSIIATVVRASSDAPFSLLQLGRRGDPLAVAVPEQQVYAHNHDNPADPVASVYPAADGFAFDYPFVVVTGDPTRAAAADRVLGALRSEAGRRSLAAAGFRGPDGTPGAELRSGTGVEASAAADGRVPDPAVADSAAGAWARVKRPTRLLAVLDTSGSMGKAVPRANGATRLDLTVRASIAGLALYADETAVGLWTFTTDLTPRTDYSQVVPVAPLSAGPDGVTGRQRMVAALAQVHVQKGRTGLYDTVLAAVREMRRTWDPDRANSIVVITDGGDTDRHTVGRARLLDLLRAENDPKRPVPVFTIAYGPSGDTATLGAISRATGGKAYVAPDPRMIGAVLQDAIGSRVCSPDC